MRKGIAALTLLLCTASLAHAAVSATIGKYNYSLNTDKKTATLEKKGYGGAYTSVEIPATVEYEGENYAVVSIGIEAFKGSTASVITIPGTIKSVSTAAFQNCYGAQEIRIEAGEADLTLNRDSFTQTVDADAVFPSQKLYLGRHINNTTPVSTVFSLLNITEVVVQGSAGTVQNTLIAGCKNLTNVTIESGVTVIESEAFSNDTALTGLFVPEGVAVIGQDAFMHCSGLTQLDFPSTLTSLVGEYALYDSPALTDIVLRSQTPPAVEAKLFNVNKDLHITIHVPQGTLAAYQNSGWSGYAGVAFTEDQAPAPEGIKVTFSAQGRGSMQIEGREPLVADGTGTVTLDAGTPLLNVLLTADAGAELARFAAAGADGSALPCTLTRTLGVTRMAIKPGDGAVALSAEFAAIPSVTLTVKMPSATTEALIYKIPTGEPYQFQYKPDAGRKLVSAMLGAKPLAFTVTPEGNANITIPAGQTADAVVTLVVEDGVMTSVPVHDDDILISVQGDALHIAGLHPGTDVQIYDIAGRTLYSSTARVSGLTTPAMPSGILIVKAGARTFRLRL